MTDQPQPVRPWPENARLINARSRITQNWTKSTGSSFRSKRGSEISDVIDEEMGKVVRDNCGRNGLDEHGN